MSSHDLPLIHIRGSEPTRNHQSVLDFLRERGKGGLPDGTMNKASSILNPALYES